MLIPFNKPTSVGNEQRYVLEALHSGHTSGDGSFTRRCRQLLELELSARSALLTTSCTHALEMAALLLDFKPGDEFIVPSFTFVSSVNAFVLRGAKPVFCDIRFDTKNIDETKIEQLVTKHTRAIIPVHYAGVACEMETICEIAKTYNLAIIEDNAHGIFGKYKGQYLGSFGELSTLSFHETKNIQCGEGGALIINDEKFSERAEIIREKGTNRARFFRGQVDKYSWVDVGSSYLPSDLLAAYLLGQLECKAEIGARRRHIWDAYSVGLHEWADSNGTLLPFVPNWCEQSFHMFYMILPTLEKRQNLINHLKQKGILSVSHYVPLHASEMGRQFGYSAGYCPIAEDVSERILRLPIYTSLSDSEQAAVIEAITSFSFAPSVVSIC